MLAKSRRLWGTVSAVAFSNLGEDQKHILGSLRERPDEGALCDGDDRDDVVTGRLLEKVDFADDTAELGVVVDGGEVDDELDGGGLPAVRGLDGGREQARQRVDALVLHAEELADVFLERQFVHRRRDDAGLAAEDGVEEVAFGGSRRIDEHERLVDRVVLDEVEDVLFLERLSGPWVRRRRVEGLPEFRTNLPAGFQSLLIDVAKDEDSTSDNFHGITNFSNVDTSDFQRQQNRHHRSRGLVQPHRKKSGWRKQVVQRRDTDRRPTKISAVDRHGMQPKISLRRSAEPWALKSAGPRQKCQQ
mmetsp:Transcript_18765/g.60664  ORF Transcript_18765/g.60664 Transcript_18765/m.60664 type:complete len:303 (+) Transcript_18765:112-1020(+)